MTHLNLFPAGVRRKTVLRRRLVQWAAACGGTLLLCLGMGWSHWTACAADREELESLERQHRPFAKMQAEINEIRRRMEDLRTQERLGMELADQRSMTSLMGLLSRSADACGRNICVQTLSLTRSRDKTNEGVAANTLSIEGVATSHLEVARFMTLLSEAKMFSSVELKRSAPQQVGGHTANAYQLECTY